MLGIICNHRVKVFKRIFENSEIRLNIFSTEVGCYFHLRTFLKIKSNLYFPFSYSPTNTHVSSSKQPFASVTATVFMCNDRSISCVLLNTLAKHGKLHTQFSFYKNSASLALCSMKNAAIMHAFPQKSNCCLLQYAASSRCFPIRWVLNKLIYQSFIIN